MEKPLAPLLVGDKTYAPEELFYTKFNSEQLLFEASFHVMRIFGSVEP